MQDTSTVITKFKNLCSEIIDIDRRKVSQYPQVTLLGRDCYLWDEYVIKSSPGIWNFKTTHEINMLKHINSEVKTNQFPLLLSEYRYKNRDFMLLPYIPFLNLHDSLYKNRLRGFKLTPKVISKLKKESESILDSLAKLNIIHRDISPPNILLNPITNDMILIDFGYAVFQGNEIKPPNKEAKTLLENALKNSLGGDYRHPSNHFTFESDKYAMEKIIFELTQLSPWFRLPKPLSSIFGLHKN